MQSHAGIQAGSPQRHGCRTLAPPSPRRLPFSQKQHALPGQGGLVLFWVYTLKFYMCKSPSASCSCSICLLQEQLLGREKRGCCVFSTRKGDCFLCRFLPCLAPKQRYFCCAKQVSFVLLPETNAQTKVEWGVRGGGEEHGEGSKHENG